MLAFGEIYVLIFKFLDLLLQIPSLAFQILDLFDKLKNVYLFTNRFQLLAVVARGNLSISLSLRLKSLNSIGRYISRTPYPITVLAFVAAVRWVIPVLF